jgi:hypothetical protein
MTTPSEPGTGEARAAAGRNGFPASIPAAAALYLAMGLAPIPLPPRSKDPGYVGWQHLRVTADTLGDYFLPQQLHNIGILNGGPSNNHLDVDLDAPEARQLASKLLPATGWVFGRASSPCSHRIYKVDCCPDTAARTFEDLDGSMILELRGTGSMTVFPPSLHRETGERIEWATFEQPGEVTLDELQRAVRQLAAAALLARHWPDQGSRDRAAMALSGALLREGWKEEEVSDFCGAVAVAAGDEEASMRAAKAAPTAEKQEDGKKTTGWPRLAEIVGDAVVRRARDWLGISSPCRGEPPITPEALPWPDPPAEEAFYGLGGRIVRAIEPASEADPVALLVQTLVMFGSVIGRSAHFVVEADRHCGNEFVVLVGRTSKARKGTSWGRVERLFREVEGPWAAERVQSGLSSGEGLIWAVRDPIFKRERIKERGEDVRFEEVEEDPGISDKRLLVYEPEYANVLKQSERPGNTLSVILRHAWDGRPLQSMTKNSPVKSTGAHISLVGNITVEEYRRTLTQTEIANGSANRGLPVCADRSKLLPLGGRVDPDAWTLLRGELAQALAFAKTTGEVERDEEATAIWCDVYAELSEGKPGLAGAMLARAEAHAMRLAMLYALLDRSALIRAPHLLAALALWDYVERSVYFIFGDSLGDAVADELLRLLRACPEGRTRNELQDYFGRNQSSVRIGRALGLLLQHHLAFCAREETGGRPAERWFAATRRS